jgi:hypothetical protein
VKEAKDEQRTKPLYIRMRPSIRAAIEEDRQAKGQNLVEWIERAAEAHLERAAS